MNSNKANKIIRRSVRTHGVHDVVDCGKCNGEGAYWNESNEDWDECIFCHGTGDIKIKFTAIGPALMEGIQNVN